MSSLIFIDDERVTVLEGIVKCPVNLALGLRDQDLTPVQIEHLASKPTGQERLRQIWYVKNTLTIQEREQFNKLTKNKQVEFLNRLVEECKAQTRDMTPWPLEVEKEKNPDSENLQETLADVQGILNTGMPEIMRSNNTGTLDLTQKLDSWETIRRALDQQAREERPTINTESVGEDVREMLNVTNEIWQHPSDKNLYILPLGKEIPAVYQGSDKLPKYMLLALQEYWAKRDEPVPLIPYKEGGDMVRWADMVMLTIARAVQDLPTKKQKLWMQIAQSSKILDALPDIERYVRNPKVSYIRLCYEVRKGLNQDSSRADLQEEYGLAKQLVSETPVIFIDRVNRLRQMAYGTGTDDVEEPTYENSWNQHYEVCTKGLINKQLMSEVHRTNPRAQGELREAVKAADLWLRRSVKQGLVPGQIDPRALVGLTSNPGISVLQQAKRDYSHLQCNYCKKTGHTEARCWNKTPRSCFKCGKPGHLKVDCPENTDRVAKIQNMEESGVTRDIGMENLHYPVFQAGSQQ